MRCLGLMGGKGTYAGFVVMCDRVWLVVFFFFQAEDGIRGLVRSRGLGDVYKRQSSGSPSSRRRASSSAHGRTSSASARPARRTAPRSCLLYKSDAADDLPCVDLGGRRIIKKKKTVYYINSITNHNASYINQQPTHNIQPHQHP